LSPRKPARQPKNGGEIAAVPETADAAAPSGATGTPLIVASIEVRWSDLDAFNHVNNATYLTYLEEARLQWLKHVPGPWFDEQSMPVLAASEVNYRQSIEWPARLHVELCCPRLGKSSMTIAHRIVDADDATRLYSDGQVVLVWMNPASGKSVPLPDAIRSSVV
jgi:acyl-CoA thioester hydrolase